MISRKKRILSLLLALSMTLSATGCVKKSSLLEGTLLENARVFNCDGDIIVAAYLSKGGAPTHPHYKDIISGNVFAIEKCDYLDVKYFDKVEELGLISNFLTEEELLKVSSDKLTEEDIIKILMRVTSQDNKKEDDSKTLSLTGK